jgi:3',5'-cyclic AMP phosphodiesterase CpdA
VRLVHLSDIHVWRYAFNPIRLFSKRAVGMVELLGGRARRFRLERLAEVVARVKSLAPDHILITGDLTTTALSSEFRAARLALGDLLREPNRVTVLPGNHDRYTRGSVRSRKFEAFFGEFASGSTYPWLRRVDDETAILGLDPTRSHISARGYLPPDQLAHAQALVADPAKRPRRLIVACHYPVVAPPFYQAELHAKRLKNAHALREWLNGVGPHLYCCGHVHAAWSYVSPDLRNQLCLNSGAPLMRDKTGFRMPGFLEIDLEGDGVLAIHHAWTGIDWMRAPLLESPHFFAPTAPTTTPAA